MMTVRGATGHTSAHEICAAVAERITSCELSAGERLTEERLSRDFGVSRTPVREALRLLEQSGLIERAGNRGYAVRAFDLRQADQIYSVRVVLEEFVVELAAAAVGTAAFADLRAAAQRAAGPDRSDGQDDLRERFHEQLAELAGNSEALRLLRDMNSRIFAMRRLDSALPARAREAQFEHLRILTLLEAGDVAGARQEMRLHIERSQTTLRALIDAGVVTISFGTLATGAEVP
jgi:DNA-binding GntR family transcriptional regulator